VQAGVKVILKQQVEDLSDELNKLIKLIRFMREQVERDMKTEDLDTKAVIKATNELANAYSRCVDAKVKLDKHLAAQDEDITDDEQIAAMVEYVKELAPRKRKNFLQELMDFHRIRCKPEDTVA
jgi:hypothetical protein